VSRRSAGVGFTDIVKRPCACADDVASEEFDYGRGQLLDKLKSHRPGLIVFTFKKTTEKLVASFDGYGFVPGLEVAGIPAFVMPGPYERRDRVYAVLADRRQQLAGLAGRR
jgi:hypothetical protein